MKRVLLLACLPLMLVACNETESAALENDWEEKHEVHFHIDCTKNTLAQGGSEADARAHCDCLLSKLKVKYVDGPTAMKSLTEEIITQMEAECSK